MMGLSIAKCRWPIVFAALLIAASLAPLARAQPATTQPGGPFTYERVVRTAPPNNVHIVTIDLTDPTVQLKVAPGGADPDGPGIWQTTLMTVRQIAEREQFDVAINACFFAVAPPTSQPADGPRYRLGAPSRSIGWAMTDGRLWSEQNPNRWPILWVENGRQVRIDDPPRVPQAARQVVAGNVLLLNDGKPIPQTGMMDVRHPRTAVGINRDRTKLVLFIVDGRRLPVSVGMTGSELVEEMQQLGCWDAINLDGGGSTTLVLRDSETGELKVMNQPSDNSERPVASVLGLRFSRSHQTTRPVPGAVPSNN